MLPPRRTTLTVSTMAPNDTMANTVCGHKPPVSLPVPKQEVTDVEAEVDGCDEAGTACMTGAQRGVAFGLRQTWRGAPTRAEIVLRLMCASVSSMRTEKTLDGAGAPIDRQLARSSVKNCAHVAQDHYTVNRTITQ